MEERLTLDGVELALSASGAVIWASDWTAVHRLADAGKLRRVPSGPGTFGHVDLYARGSTREQSEQHYGCRMRETGFDS